MRIYLFCQKMALVGALRFEQRRSKTRDLQSPPDTVTGLNTHIETHYTTGLGLLLYPVTAEHEVISGPIP